MKEMPAAELRRSDDDQRYSTNTRARVTQGADPAIHDRTMRIWTAWATYANEGLHREDLDGSRPLGAARLFTPAVAICPPTKRRSMHRALLTARAAVPVERPLQPPPAFRRDPCAGRPPSCGCRRDRTTMRPFGCRWLP